MHIYLDLRYKQPVDRMCMSAYIYTQIHVYICIYIIYTCVY